MISEPPVRIVPIALRERQERYTHVAQRLLERSGIAWPVERVEALEKKIKFVRTQINQCKSVPHILPTKIAETKEGQCHHYRVLIAGEAHTFLWSQVCRGIISYLGKGEIRESLKKEEAQSA